VELAPRRDCGGARGRARHVGYYLVDEGLPELERATGYRPRARARAPLGAAPPQRRVRRRASLAAPRRRSRPCSGWRAEARGGLAASCCWSRSSPRATSPVSVVNQLVTAFCRRARCPSSTCAAAAASRRVPHRRGRPHAVRQRRGGAGGAREPGGAVPRQPRGAPPLRRPERLHRRGRPRRARGRGDRRAPPWTACGAERALRGRRAQDAFYLFHRPRRWNPRQGVWMGWERKRGKLAEFNRFLRGGARTRSRRRRRREPLRGVRYVITLDADTVLPPDAAVPDRRHRAPAQPRRVRPGAGRVVRGYGILQPRVGVSLPSAHRSRFAAIHSGAPGRRSVHHRRLRRLPGPVRRGQLHGEGDLRRRRVRAATHGRFPENTLLSHDLIEGSYARAGLAPRSPSTTTTRPLPDVHARASTAGSAATGSCCAG
jgi:cyclic beta-1,2-glucan synthetase